MAKRKLETLYKATGSDGVAFHDGRTRYVDGDLVEAVDAWVAAAVEVALEMCGLRTSCCHIPSSRTASLSERDEARAEVERIKLELASWLMGAKRGIDAELVL